MLKTLIMVVYLVLDPQYGQVGAKLASYSYVTSFEECTTKAIPYVRNMFANDAAGKLDFYMAMCVEITEEEDKDPTNAVRDIYLRDANHY